MRVMAWGEAGCFRRSAMKATANICQTSAHRLAIIAAKAGMSRRSQRGGQRRLMHAVSHGSPRWGTHASGTV